MVHCKDSAILPRSIVEDIVARALDEDRARADVTARALIGPEIKADAVLISKGRGILCGIDIFSASFRLLDPRVRLRLLARDGSAVKPGMALARLTGPARSILSAERTALNFIQQLSGVASLTAAFVRAVQGTGTRICDTRKTIPGLRLLQKYAVRCGGGTNHRMDLSAMALIKDNHRALTADLSSAVAGLRRSHPGLPIEIESQSPAQTREALAARADIIMLDNMRGSILARAVALVRNFRRAHRSATPLIEISGGVSLSTVRQIALAGADVISVGALTHSAPALDLSLEIDIHV